MKNLHMSAAAILLFVPLLGTAMGQPKHPNLIFNRQEVAEMKARIDKYPWARQTFERIKADAEADATNPHHNIPTRVATAMMYALTGEEKYARPARHHVVSHLSICSMPSAIPFSRWRWQPNTSMARICTIGGLPTATRSRTCCRGTST